MPRKPRDPNENVLPFTKPEPAPRKRAPRKATAKNLNVAARRADACQLKLAGLSHSQIAEALAKKYKQAAYNKSQVSRDLRESLALIIDEPARELLHEELTRLNAMQAAIWAEVSRGNLEAQRQQLRIMHQRALYYGWYAPVKQQLLGPDANDATANFNLADPAELNTAALATINTLIEDVQRRAVGGEDHAE